MLFVLPPPTSQLSNRPHQSPGWSFERDGAPDQLPELARIDARSADHVADNLKAFELQLDLRDRESIDEILACRPGPPGDIFGLESTPGGRHAVIMKTDLNREDPGRDR